MDPSFDRKESDIYRMDRADRAAWYDDASDGSSSIQEFVEEMHNDDDILVDLGRNQHEQRPQSQMIQPVDNHPQDQSHHRPPPISTDWEASVDVDDEDENGQEEKVEVTANDKQALINARVSFNVPEKSTMGGAAAAPMPSSSMIHFQNPKRYNDNFASPYPTQSLRPALLNKTPNTVRASGSSSLAEVTPAFLRRAAQDLGVASTTNVHTAATSGVNSNLQEPVPPNSLMNRRDRPSSNNIVNSSSSLPDSSFYGADASALDGTFVSIRDLNDDDDVPSVDNDQFWNLNSTTNDKETGNAGDGFATETTSLLGGRKKMPWQGGFFGSQMAKEDRRERRKMMRARGRGWFSEGMWTLRCLLSSGSEKKFNVDNGRGQWEANHPIGGDFMTNYGNNARGGGRGGLPRQRVFSMLLIGILCFHMALCGLHDLFLRYLSYRNPEEGGEAEVSWNGEGQYIPAYWTTFDGRVLNPLVGPGARTLTAFGALVPGLVLSKGHSWRVAASLFETSSFLQLILHIWALKTVIGGSITGLEWKRGTFTAASLYLISALIGSAWSIAVEPGRLITASGMGIAGLLSAAIVERACFPLPCKDDENEADTSSQQNENGSGSNAVASSSNEQFSFQPPTSQKKKRRNPLNSSGDSPVLLLLLELLASWLATYTSLPGTATAAMTGAACALLLFVGCPPPGSLDIIANQDLVFNETPPPPPPPRNFAAGDNWRDDDNSEDTSIEAGRQAFNTPLMRRSILADEDDEEEPLGTRSSLRKRYVNGSSAKTPNLKGRTISVKNKRPFSASRTIAHVIGILLALLLTLIPASLIATGEGPSSEVTRASVLGCRPMRILYKEDDDSDLFECAGGCIPLSRERIARRKEGMRSGRCDTIGYRCWQQSGTMTLRNYDANVGIYVVPSADGSCGNAAGDEDGEGNNNNDDASTETADANNGEVEGAQ